MCHLFRACLVFKEDIYSNLVKEAESIKKEVRSDI